MARNGLSSTKSCFAAPFGRIWGNAVVCAAAMVATHTIREVNTGGYLINLTGCSRRARCILAGALTPYRDCRKPAAAIDDDHSYIVLTEPARPQSRLSASLASV